MIETLSLCPVCYKKIPASIVFVNDNAVMQKECDAHGPFSAIVERDVQHISNFYQYGTMGNNNSIIIHAHNGCNMKCPWCYYPMGEEAMHPASYYDALLGQYKMQGFNLLLSGGEPTLRPDYLDFVKETHRRGWFTSSITNMLRLADPDFFNDTMNDFFVAGNTYKFAMSMQHPKNYSKEVFDAKMKALENIEKAGLKAMCVMFSIQGLDELDWIREFYNNTKNCYVMLRIRTMFRNWANKGDTHHIWLSHLHKHFLRLFGDLHPVISNRVELSNIYCLYMQMDGGRMNVSLSSAPTVENVDYHALSRPVHMLAMDGRCYPVALCQIINEGIAAGWKDGFRIKQDEVPICG